MMQRCHFGVQGIAKTEQDVKLALDRLMQTGFKPMAFDTEMNFVPMLKELTQGEINLHCAVSYPLGRMTLKKKMQDLETLLKMGILDVCVCLDWQAIFSHRYKDVEREAAAIVKEFPNRFDIHPSGNIRTLEAFEKYMDLGCQVIHTASALDIVETFMKRQLAIYGGIEE